MKAKLFAILSLVIVVTGMSIMFSPPVEAKGEKYKWIDKNTIEASGGNYKELEGSRNNRAIKFTRGSGFKEGGITNLCTIEITLVPSADSTTGSISIVTAGTFGTVASDRLCESYAKEFDKSFTIDNAENASIAPEGTDDESASTGADKPTSCAIDGIGWIVCPVITFLSKIVDGAYNVVSALMTVQPLVSTNQDGKASSIYVAWSAMRNIANVAFVIAFLFIIFSQVTNAGITNYGIKKMLPRLVVSAILVNTSFWLCAAAVDLSNIAGSSIVNVFRGIGASMPFTGEYSGTQVAGSGWEFLFKSIIAGGVATTAALYVLLSAFVPMLLMAVIAIVITLLVLAIRQGLIVVFIVVAPIALVLRILPNTESVYKKWKTIGTALLLGYPGVGFLFGGSELAAQVIMVSASGDLKVVIQIVGAFVKVAPLAITPIVIKVAGVPSNIIGKLQGATGKGPIAGLKEGAKEYNKNRRTLRQGRVLNGGKAMPLYGTWLKAGLRRKAVANSREGGLKDVQARYISEEARRDKGKNAFTKRMAGGSLVTPANERAQNAVAAAAFNEEKKNFQTDVSNMEALVRVNFEDPKKALEEAIKKGDRIQAVAAQNVLFKSGSSGISNFRDAIQLAENDPKNPEYAGYNQVVEDLRSNISEVHGKYAKEKGADVVKWATAKREKDSNGNPVLVKLSETLAPKMSAADIVGQHSDSIKKMVDHEQISREVATTILSDPRLSNQLDDNKKAQLSRVTARIEDANVAHAVAIEEDKTHSQPN